MESKWIIQGREISNGDIALIRRLIEEHFHRGCKQISRRICYRWKWYQASGQPKERACRAILLFLEKKKLIGLPPPIKPANNEKRKIKRIKLEKIFLEGRVKEHPGLRLEIISKRHEYSLWNKIIHSYHYHGHQVIVGKFLKYIASIGNRSGKGIKNHAVIASLLQTAKLNNHYRSTELTQTFQRNVWRLLPASATHSS